MFDLQEYIKLMNEKDRLETRDKGLSPKEILDFLNYKKVPENYIILFENWNYPDYFHSYRWSYCELALGQQNEKEKTIKEFKKELEKVNWAVYEGWKGWDYKMSWHDAIHLVPEEWNTSNEFLENIKIEDNKVILTIKEVED